MSQYIISYAAHRHDVSNVTLAGTGAPVQRLPQPSRSTTGRARNAGRGNGDRAISVEALESRLMFGGTSRYSCGEWWAYNDAWGY
jgi:hypothetical protein